MANGKAGRPPKVKFKSVPMKERPVAQEASPLPKEIIGGHGGAMVKPPQPIGAKGPAIPRPAKMPPRGRVAPPKLPTERL